MNIIKIQAISSNLIKECKNRFHEVESKIRSNTVIRFCRLFMHDFKNFDLMRLSTSMAYTTLLSIIPSLAFVFAILSVFRPLLGEEGKILSIIREKILMYLTTGAGSQAIDYIEKFLGNLDLTKIGIAGGITTLVCLINLLGQVEKVYNKIFSVHRNRNSITRFAFFWTLLTLGIFIFGVAAALIHKVNLSQSIGADASFFADTFSGEVMSLMSKVIFCFFLLKIVPNCKVKTKHAAYGALFSGVAIHIAVDLYTYFATNLASYSLIYGALAAIPLFLLWLNFGWFLLLFGAVITRRSSLGNKFDEKYERALNRGRQANYIKRTRYKSLLPTLIVLETFMYFEKMKKKGLLLETLPARYSVPESWVDEAVEKLQNLRLVHILSHENGDSEILPTIPSNQLKISSIQKWLMPDVASCLHENLSKKDPELVKIISEISQECNQQNSAKSIQDFLNTKAA